MNKLLLNIDVYTEKNIRRTCDVYRDYAKITISRKDNYMELIFNDCIYKPSITMKEFENYLINIENLMK